LRKVTDATGKELVKEVLYDGYSQVWKVKDGLDRTSEYTFDGDGDLTLAKRPDGTQTIAVYDLYGTRAKVGARTFLRAGAGVTAGVLDDGNAKYTPGVSEVRSGTTTYSHSGLKHMGAQTGSGDTAAATNTYDAFGGVQGSTGSWQGPFGTAGAFGYQSPQTGSEQGGMHLLGHRYYDASTGRFLTRDPIGDGSNWYAYCENNPTAFADPNGEWIVIVVAIVAAIVLFDSGRRCFEKGKEESDKKHKNWQDTYEDFDEDTWTGDEWQSHRERMGEGVEAARLMALEEMRGHYFNGPIVRSGGAVIGGGLYFHDGGVGHGLDEAVGAGETVVDAILKGSESGRR